MPRRNTRRNGVVSRILSPVNEGLRMVTNAGSNVFNAGKGVWRIAGTGSRRVIGRVSHGLDSTGRRLLTGKRRQAGGRRSRKTRKNRKSRMDRKDRKDRH
jgi:hypothetical protein